jgi:PadR family transcriptional regulator PadR
MATTSKSKSANPMLHGTLDALILKTLSHGKRHGYAIARWIEQTTDDQILVEDGSLYPSLYRMERRGLIEAGWGKSDLGRRAKIFRLTRAGRKQLKVETLRWESFNVAVSKILFIEN